MAENDDNRLELLLNELLDTLKGFIRKHQVRPEEYRKAVLFLHEAGQMGEIPLMADVFLETTVDEVAYGDQAGAGFVSAIEGPYYIEGAPELEPPYELPRRENEPGDVLFFRGTVGDENGNPLAGVVLDLWQCDAEGKYSNIHPGVPENNLRGRFRTDDQGRFEVRTIAPAPYEIPTQGPTGRLLAVQGKHTFRPAHLHLKVSHEGHETLTTQIYFEGGEYVEDDCVGAVKPELVVPLEKHDDPSDYRERGLDGPYYTLDYDFVLIPAREKAPA
jgi:catechol 1,2-dioxygenase